MSLQDKISSAKPTTFLTDGLSEEEVKHAVDEGRKRMSDNIKLIIELPKDYYEALAKTEEIIFSQRSGKTFMSVIYSAVVKGIPLDDVKAEISKCKTRHEMQLSERDEKGKLLISDVFCDVIKIFNSMGKESEE